MQSSTASDRKSTSISLARSNVNGVIIIPNLTGLEKVNGEHSLIMLVHNIKRSINILGVADLIAKLKKWNSPYKAKVLFLLKTGYLKLNTTTNFYQEKLAA